MPSDRPDVMEVGSADLTRVEAIRKIEHILKRLKSPETEILESRALISRELEHDHDSDLEREVPKTIRAPDGTVELVTDHEHGRFVLEYRFVNESVDLEQNDREDRDAPDDSQ